jgi:hypothetical protein
MCHTKQIKNSVQKIFVALVFLMIGVHAQANNIRKITGWNEELPISSKVILAELRAEAAYLSYETDDFVCGGNVLAPELVDAEELKHADGTITYNLRVRFQVTKAINYCASETQMTCEAPFQVSEQSDVVMGSWSCN